MVRGTYNFFSIIGVVVAAQQLSMLVVTIRSWVPISRKAGLFLVPSSLKCDQIQIPHSGSAQLIFLCIGCLVVMGTVRPNKLNKHEVDSKVLPREKPGQN